MYVKAAIYKVQVLGHTTPDGEKVWMDVNPAARMTTCKAIRAFNDGADSPLTMRTVYVESRDAVAGS